MSYPTESTLLVTGGCGFIGSHFIKRILKNRQSPRIINLDALTYAAQPDNLPDLTTEKSYEFIKGDIRDRELIQSVFQKYQPNLIINFAAETHVDRSIIDPQLFFLVNVQGTQILLDVAREHWSIQSNDQRKLFLQISTDEVYGAGEEKTAFNEASPLLPNNPYAASKAAADLLVRAYRQTYGLPTIISRSCNNFGLNQYPEKLIPLVLQRALANQTIPIYGTGMQSREWLYVEDHCRALEMILIRGIIGETYNIGSGQELTNLELVTLILELLGKGQELLTFVADRPAHDQRYLLDCRKIQTELHWSAESNVQKKLKEMITELTKRS